MNDSGKKSGLSWVWVGIISALMVLVFLTFIIFVPNFHDHGAPKERARWACIMNLRMIEGAEMTWASENQKNTNAVPTDADLFGPTSYIREKPACPSSGNYTIGAVGEKPRCSIPGHTL